MEIGIGFLTQKELELEQELPNERLNLPNGFGDGPKCTL